MFSFHLTGCKSHMTNLPGLLNSFFFLYPLKITSFSLQKLKAKRNPFPSENKSLSSLLSDNLSLTDCDSTMSSSTSGMSATLQPPTKNRDDQMVKAVHSNQNNSKTSRGDIEASGNVRPKTILCTLCNYKFDEKQVICFSYNPYCKHVFHAICMIDYLMKGCDTCPICNNWFLKIE